MYNQKRQFTLVALALILFLVLACNLPLSTTESEAIDESEVADEPAELSSEPEDSDEPVTPSDPIAPPPSSPPADPGDCTMYIASGGNDGNPGSEEQPWGTLQHSVDSAGPGDVICVASGEYTVDNTALEFTNSGTSEQPITLTTYNGPVVINCIIDILRGASHLRVHGFSIRNIGDWGISLYGDNEDVILSGLEVGGGESALHFTIGDSGEEPIYGPVSNITVRDSIFHDVIYTAVDCTPGPCNDMFFQNLEIFGAGMGGEGSYGSDGLALERGRNILVEDCYIHDNSGDGIDLNSRDAMLGDDAGTVIVRRNRVEDITLDGIKLWRGGEASNNIVRNVGGALLILELGSDYHIVNNTFANCTTYSYLATLGYDPFPGSTSVTLFNNIFYNDNPVMGGTSLYVSGAVDLVSGNNLFYNPYREEDVICIEDDCFNMNQINDGSYFSQSGNGENSLYADPLFLDAENGDLHLSAGSPALDAGEGSSAPDEDLDGAPRPEGEAPDIGAYEGGG
jgi:hypothetical protein